jgi:3-hydroxyisobutyrate dehydrogenase-like beta-hydroxyacid dehydrogenase
VIATAPDGVVAGLAAGTIWVEMSTVSPHTSRNVAVLVKARSATMLDAPVSGSVPQARDGTLTIMVGGDKDGYARVEPILRDLGTPSHIGANGQGLALKLAINISVAVQMIAFAEGLLLADRSGVDDELALKLMTESTIGSPLLKARAPFVLHLPDEAWFDLRLMHKDLELALDAARRLDVPLPTADRADEVVLAAHWLGFERRDLAAVFEVLEHMTPRPPTSRGATLAGRRTA